MSKSNTKAVKGRQGKGATGVGTQKLAIIVAGGVVQGVRANFPASVAIYDIDDMSETRTEKQAYQEMEAETKDLTQHIF